ncbi:MAG: ABC transporter ATP-binding protein [Spirochaetales bacterium]|nr:ABC transporter ATP-binding protein [Spirochaetales bacterium]
MDNTLLSIRNLHTSFFTHVGEVKAVQNVSYDVRRGEILGVVGESGSGKSVSYMSCMRLLQEPGRIMGGDVQFKGESLLSKTNRQMRNIRGNRMSMIFQNPMTSLNAVLKIGDQITEPLREHKNMSRAEAKREAISLLERVQIPDAEKRLSAYPHEFSGGMRQRVLIAMAIACRPDLIIADEPTTALDVTIQSQILELMKDLQQDLGTSIVFITHDLGVIAETCSRVVVMYGSMVMEEAPVDDIFHRPAHPYTEGLLRSIPKPGMEDKRLSPIPGSPPVQLSPPPGCPFAPRCNYAMNICRRRLPEFTKIGENHRSACWLLSGHAPSNNFRRENI